MNTYILNQGPNKPTNVILPDTSQKGEEINDIQEHTDGNDAGVTEAVAEPEK